MGRELRGAVLATDPAAVGLEGEGDDAWGVVMDTVFDDGGWYTLVALADGTTSLYTSGSFGVVGAGEHEAVRAASLVLVTQAEGVQSVFAASTDVELPPPGSVAIRLLTFEGQKLVVAPEDDLGDESHPASAIFYAAHDVIGRVRQLSDDQD